MLLSSRQARMRFISLLATAICFSVGTSCTKPPEPSYRGYGYLIIAPQKAMPAVQDFALYKESKGLRVNLVSLEEILTGSPGQDDPEKIRNYLTGYAPLTPQREFVLLVGSMDTIPMRIAHTDPDDHDASDVPTDFYYEDLTADWDADGDGYFGEYGDDMSPATEDYRAELYLGRIPWDGNEEIRSICDTIIQYEEDTSTRMRQSLIAGATIEFDCDSPIALNLANALCFQPAGYIVTALYEDCPSAHPDMELTRENFLGQWEMIEPGFVSMISHGNPYGSYYRQPYWDTFIDTDHLPRGARPAIVTSAGCSVGAPDSDSPSLGRILVREGVAASFIGASRITDYGTNPSPVLFSMLRLPLGVMWNREALGEAKVSMLEQYAGAEKVPGNMAGPVFHQMMFLCMLYGDPAIRLPY